MPFIYKWVAAMPDVHWGIGATVGSVIPTKGAIIPAAVGVDIGCGMMAVQTTLNANQLPDNLRAIRTAIEKAVPHGRTENGAQGRPRRVARDSASGRSACGASLSAATRRSSAKYPKLNRGNDVNHLGTLGTGNHFIEVCLDESDQVWFMLHSGSRGVGNRIGTFFIELAQQRHAPAYQEPAGPRSGLLRGGQRAFRGLCRRGELGAGLRAVQPQADDGAVDRGGGRIAAKLPPFALTETAVNCHHNYVAREEHYGEQVFVTRKGAVRAGKGDMGIIPGSMGARSYIVRGLGNPREFSSAAAMAPAARCRATKPSGASRLDDHIKATAGIECRKDADVIDETPMAYKPIDDVMNAQKDLVEIVHTLQQVVCVKG